MRRPAEPAEESDDTEGPSRTQRKKAMWELQDLGVAMLNLPDTQLDTLITNENLREAFRDLRRITAHGASKRQAGYVGKLLRDFDTEPFRAALAQWHSHKARDAKALHDVEQWRERILADDQGWEAWIALCPESDTKAARALLRDARLERATALRKGERGNGRAYRALFKHLREHLLAPTSARA